MCVSIRWVLLTMCFVTLYVAGYAANFHAIMQSLSSRQLAFFCRVLALVVFEPEDRRLLESASAWMNVLGVYNVC